MRFRPGKIKEVRKSEAVTEAKKPAVKTDVKVGAKLTSKGGKKC